MGPAVFVTEGLRCCEADFWTLPAVRGFHVGSCSNRWHVPCS